MIYNYKTFVAEMFVVIISRNIDINKAALKQAILNTAKNRKTINYIDNSNKYIELISDDSR